MTRRRGSSSGSCGSERAVHCREFLIGVPGMSVYGATRSALESLTRSWAAEFARAGVRVNTVSPGPTSSEKVIGVMGDAAGQLGATAFWSPATGANFGPMRPRGLAPPRSGLHAKVNRGR